MPYTEYGGAESYTLVVINPGDQPVPYSLRFANAEGSGTSYPLDRFDRGVLTARGSWVLAGSPTVQAGRAVFSGAADERLLWQGWIAADVGVQAQFRLPPLGNATATLLARAAVVGGKLTAYEARLVRLNGVLTAQLYRTVNGVCVRLGQSASLGRRLGRVLRLDIQGQHLRVLLDGRVVVEATDAALLPAGLTGLKGTAGVSADDFQAAATAAALLLSYCAAGPGLGAAWQPVAGTFTCPNDRLVAGGTARATAVYVPAWLAEVAVQADYDLQLGQSGGLLARHSSVGTAHSYYEARLSSAATG